jgi:hypothetical protein
MFREREAKELFQRRVEEERRKQAESRELGKALTEQGARFEREGTERAMAEAERDKEEAEREAEHAQKEAERKDRQRIADIARDPEAMARAQQLLMGAGGPGAGVHAVHAIKGQLGVELGISAADAYQVAMEALTALIQQMRQENLRMRRISDQTAAWARHAMWEAGAMPMTGQNNGRP